MTIFAEFGPLHDESEAYAEALRNASSEGQTQAQQRILPRLCKLRVSVGCRRNEHIAVAGASSMRRLYSRLGKQP